MGRHRAPDVVFDWEGSLALARLAWTTADQLDALTAGRRQSAAAALSRWQGSTAVQFGDRIEVESLTSVAIAGALRDEAMAWAVEWTKAIDQENFNRYQVACENARDGGSFWDSATDAMFGEDDLPPQPGRATVPSAPHFAPTRSFARY